MRSNAVGGGYCTLSLAWEGAVMMPLQLLHKEIELDQNKIYLIKLKLIKIEKSPMILTNRSIVTKEGLLFCAGCSSGPYGVDTSSAVKASVLLYTL
jgi:hypothetical protein